MPSSSLKVITSPDATEKRERNFSDGPQAGLYLSSRDEMNLAEFPLTVLSTRTNPSVKTLEFRDTHRSKTGEMVERQWIITGADKFGLPTATDDDVVLALICLTMERGFRERKVFFTRYELMKILRWAPEGRNYQRITKSLDRLSGVRIRATNAFFDNAAKGYQTCNFGIIDAYEINDGRAKKDAPDPTGEGSFFIWSEMIFDSFKAGFIKKLDLEFYFSLQSAVSRRLYRYLDKHFYYRDVIDRPLMTLAFEKLGLSRSYRFVSSVKQQLEPAIEELSKAGFLAQAEYLGRGSATVIRFKARNESAGAGSVNVSQPSVSRETQEILAPTPPARPMNAGIELGSVVEALIERGIAADQAKRAITGKNDAELEKISRIIRYFDHLVTTKGKGAFRSVTGFLFKAVSEPERFVIPAHFEVSGAKTPARVSAKQERKKVEKAEAVEARDGELRKQEIAELRRRVPHAEIQAIDFDVRKKLACLKNILEKVRFEEAVEGCVNEEIRRRYGSSADSASDLKLVARAGE